MASALPKRDASVSWPVHTCGVRHSGPACPPAGWLVLALCPHCVARTEYYCSNHRGRA